MAFQEVHYRPLFGRVLTIITEIICAMTLVSLLWTSPATAIRAVWPIALIGVVAWALFWRPSLRVQPHGITVENVLSTAFVPWPDIEHIETRYSLTIRTARRRVSVWVAPTSGRHRLLGLARQDFDGVGSTARGPLGSLRPSDATTTTAGNLAQTIRGRWEELRDVGLLERGSDPEAATLTWHWVTIAVVTALAAATVVAMLI